METRRAPISVSRRTFLAQWNALQVFPDQAERFGLAVGFLELPQDLRFTEHQAVQGGRHGEEMAGRLDAAGDIEILGLEMHIGGT